MRVCENGIYRDMTAEEIANLPTTSPEERITELKEKLAETAREGDLIITVGAGNIYTVGEKLAARK